MARGANVVNLGLVPYREAWELQRSLASDVAEGSRKDTIVFLDPPPLLCIWRVLRRRRRDEPARARRFLAFMAYIWRYRRTRRPAVEERIRRHEAGKQVHVLRSRRDVKQFLALVSRP